MRFGIERGELRSDMDIEMIVSILDWTVERFQDALLTAELDPGLFRRQGEMPEKKEARIRQFLEVLQRAVGAASASTARGRREIREMRKPQRRGNDRKAENVVTKWRPARCKLV